MGRFDFQGERGNGSLAIFVFRVSRASSNAKAKNAPFDRLGANRAQPRYSITISAANATVGAGSEIRVQIVQKNTTDRDQPFWIVSVAKLHGEYVFLINVTRADGNKVHRSEYFRGVRDEAGNFMPGVGMSGGIIVEKPGDSFTSSSDLNELYELTPGKYAVQVYVKDSIAKVAVKSNTITVMVTPY